MMRMKRRVCVWLVKYVLFFFELFYVLRIVFLCFVVKKKFFFTFFFLLVSYKKKKKKLKNVLMKLLLQVPPLPNVYKKKNKYEIEIFKNIFKLNTFLFRHRPKLKPKLLQMQCLLKKQQMQLLLELQRYEFKYFSNEQKENILFY